MGQVERQDALSTTADSRGREGGRAATVIRGGDGRGGRWTGTDWGLQLSLSAVASPVSNIYCFTPTPPGTQFIHLTTCRTVKL